MIYVYDKTNRNMQLLLEDYTKAITSFSIARVVSLKIEVVSYTMNTAALFVPLSGGMQYHIHAEFELERPFTDYDKEEKVEPMKEVELRIRKIDGGYMVTVDTLDENARVTTGRSLDSLLHDAIPYIESLNLQVTHAHEFVIKEDW